MHTKRCVCNTSDDSSAQRTKDIIRLKDENNYNCFFLSNHKPVLVSKTPKEYKELLLPHDFIRVHKSRLVNRSCVQYMHCDGVLRLTDHSQILYFKVKERRSNKKAGLRFFVA